MWLPFKNQNPPLSKVSFLMVSFSKPMICGPCSSLVPVISAISASSQFNFGSDLRLIRPGVGVANEVYLCDAGHENHMLYHPKGNIAAGPHS